MHEQPQTGTVLDQALDTVRDMGPRTTAVIGASAAVLAIYAMGGEMMASTLFGFPAGVWVVMAGWGAASVATRSGAEVDDEPLTISDVDTIERHRAVAAPRAAATPHASASRPAGARSHANRSAQPHSIRRRRPRHEIRIAADLDRREGEALAPDPDAMLARHPIVRWGTLEEIGAGTADAIVRRDPAGTVVIELLHASTEDPAWDDWSRPLPISYAGVFPSRIDPSRVTLEGADLDDPEEAALIGRLAEAAARASQLARPSRAEQSPAEQESMDMVIRGIADQLVRWRREETLHETTVTRAAARVVSAWITSRDNVLPDPILRETLDLCAALLADEPGAHLRLAAGCFATYADDKGLVALLAAHGLMSQRAAIEPIDPLGFILSEIQLGEERPLTLGRVASGLALVWASSDPDRLPHLRDDVLDDLRYAGWLIGRDPDHCLLKVIMRELDRVRDSHDTLWAVMDEAVEPRAGQPLLRRRSRAA